MFTPGTSTSDNLGKSRNRPLIAASERMTLFGKARRLLGGRGVIA